MYILNNLEQWDNTILHFHYGTDAGMYHNILKKAQQPKLVSFYGWDYSMFPNKFFGLGKKYLQSRVFFHCDKIIAMTKQMKEALVDLGCPEEKIIVHYYGLDTRNFIINRSSDTNSKIRLLTTSTLEPKKGHLFLLKAIKDCLDRGFSNFSLHILDTGRCRKQVINEIQKLNITSKIVFHPQYVYGSAEHHEMLKSADIFIQPSITDKQGNKEGVPGTMVEAMAAGLPVIATRHAGIPEIIENEKNGLLVDENNVEDLAKKILLLANNSELRQQLGTQAQKHATKNLDIRIKQAELEKIYDNLLI